LSCKYMFRFGMFQSFFFFEIWYMFQSTEYTVTPKSMHQSNFFDIIKCYSFQLHFFFKLELLKKKSQAET
jgi:hypothetical protein